MLSHSLSMLPMRAYGWSPTKPTLNLDFVNNTTLDAAVTFTRALNTATYFNSSGLLTTANANVARFDYDPATLSPRGLLIEESRTNTILQSRDMTQAEWTKTDVTPTRNQVGLDGVANTATLLTEGSAGGVNTAQTGSAVAAGSTITASIVVKRGNTDWFRLIACEGTTSDGGQGWFNLATGAKGATAALGAGTSISSTMTSLGGGWYRCTVTAIPNGTYTLPRIYLNSATADNSGTCVANSTYIVDCAQLEVGAFATSIIPTTTTTLTRNADSAVMTGTNFSSWFTQDAGTFAAEWVQPANSTTTVLHRVDDGTANNRIQLAILTSRTLQAVSSNSGVTTFAPLTANVFTFGAIVKSALAWDATGKTVCLNAGTVPNANNTNMPSATLTRLTLDNGGSVQINGHIRRITYYPRRLSNAELQAITS